MFKSIILGAVVAAHFSAQAFAQPYAITPTDVSFQNEEGLLIPAKLFSPAIADGARRPAVIMLHGCAGVYADGDVSKIYREWGDRLVAAGYVALLVDSFSSRTTEPQCNNGPGVGVSEVFDRPKDVDAAYDFLVQEKDKIGVNPDKIGVLGWSHGGSTVVSSLATTQPINPTLPNPNASMKPIKVGVAFYAGCGLSDFACGTQSKDPSKPASCWGGLSTSKWDSYSPLYFFHGTADTTTLLSYCNTRISRATSTPGGGTLALTAYDNATHKFDDPNVGGTTPCIDSTVTPNSCAKQQADVAALNALNQALK